jgi:hypothetical protein
MNERDARSVLLVRAIESADARAEILTASQRRQATDAARAILPAPGKGRGARDWSERLLRLRAEHLLQEAVGRHARLRALLAPSAMAVPLAWFVPLAAFALGFFTDRLTGGERINLLSAPLFGVVLWNWLMLALWGIGALVPALGRRAWPSVLPTLVGWLSWRGTPRRTGSPAIAAAAAEFRVLWARASLPLACARLSVTLHLSAAMLALGMVVGLAYQAWDVEYQVGWAGTWCATPGCAQGFLSLLFLPVGGLAQALGVDLFSLDELARIHRWAAWDPAHGARWLRLVSLLLAVGVIAPRIGLYGLMKWRALRLAARFPLALDDAAFQAILAQAGDEAVAVRVWPFSLNLAPTHREQLAAAVGGLLGHPARLEWMPVTAYGQAPQPVSSGSPPAGASGVRIALFSLAATPEAEVHGEFVERLGKAAAGSVRILVDRAAYRQRMGSALSGTRLAEREDLWRRFAQGLGVRIDLVDSQEPGP